MAILKKNIKTVQSANGNAPSPSLKPVTRGNMRNTKKIVAPNTSNTITDVPTLSPDNPLQPPIKCILSYPDKRNIVARGAIYLSSETQFIHGVTLQNDCYKVSIDEMVKMIHLYPMKLVKSEQ